MLAEAIAPFTRRRSLEDTYAYGGGTVSVLATGEETGGRFALIESIQIPGSEPPFHDHESEDELFYLLKGEFAVVVGGAVHNLSAGQTIFVPRCVPIRFVSKSAMVHMLGLIRPSGFEKWFQTLGTPAESLDLPELTGPPSEPMLERMHN